MVADFSSNALAFGSGRIGGNQPLTVVAGPCVVENPQICIEIAESVRSACESLGFNYVFKASFDKANKTIQGSYRGPGVEEGLRVLSEVRDRAHVSILSDIHEPSQAAMAAEVCDVIQIPSLLSKQMDLVVAAAQTGRTVNIKKGQFSAPWELANIVGRLSDLGFNNVSVTERGNVFGFQNLIIDFRGLEVLRGIAPVIFDASHSVHGNAGGSDFLGNNPRDFIPGLARAAVASGVDGVFFETHPDPDRALSDSAGTVSIQTLREILLQLRSIREALGETV